MFLSFCQFGFPNEVINSKKWLAKIQNECLGQIQCKISAYVLINIITIFIKHSLRWKGNQGNQGYSGNQKNVIKG